MKNKQDTRNYFLKNKNGSIKLLSIGIVVLMMLTALPIYVAQISETPLLQVNTSSISATDGFENLATAGIFCCDKDGDGYDGYYPSEGCSGNDCNDNDPTIHPGATELCDGVDNNCNGCIDEGLACGCQDKDGDGYYCYCSVYCPTGNDCNDNDATIYPGAPELCDGKDNDCDTVIDEDCGGGGCGGCTDNDHDGYNAYCPVCCPCGNDCNDNDPTINPGAPELCDGKDNDCDCLIDEGCNDHDRNKEAPTTILFYPLGGETLKGTVTVQWFVHDSQDEHWSELPIYLYYLDTSDNWYLISIESKGPQYDHIFLGEFAWSTNSIPDGTYRLLLEAIDFDGNIGYDISDPFQINNYVIAPTNDPPDQPTKPYGSNGGSTDVEYTYTSITSDPDGEQIWYLFDWGDNTDSGWLGPYASGETCEANHIWNEKSNYNIIVKAKDVSGKESSWSDPLPITMQNSFDDLMQQFFESVFHRFPNAFLLLRHLMGY